MSAKRATGVTWTDANTVAFEECGCDDPTPDAMRYALPDGPTVEVVACAECGECIEWDIDHPAAVAELRDLLREKEVTIRELRDRSEADADGVSGAAAMADSDDELEEIRVGVERIQKQQNRSRRTLSRIADEMEQQDTGTVVLGRLSRPSPPTIVTGVAFAVALGTAWLMAPAITKATREMTGAAGPAMSPLDVVVPVSMVLAIAWMVVYWVNRRVVDE